MKYIEQLILILCVAFMGELLNAVLPFPIPASIYGMAIFFVSLLTGVVRLEWANIRTFWMPILAAVFLITIIVMVITGRTVVVLDRVKDALPLGKALIEGGIACAEVTFRTEAAEEAIRVMSENVPELLVGAGNIGRGFIGAVLAEAGYHITFADVNIELINKLNELGTYTVHILDTECKEMVVTDVSGVISATQDVVDEIAGAELVTTSVGLFILPRIAGAVAKGIVARKEIGCEEYLNIIACENAICASTQLKILVYDHLDEENEKHEIAVSSKRKWSV